MTKKLQVLVVTLCKNNIFFEKKSNFLKKGIKYLKRYPIYITSKSRKFTWG